MDAERALEEALKALQLDPQAEEHWAVIDAGLRPFIVTVAHRALGSGHGFHAEDIAQETFMQLTHAPVLTRFESVPQLRAYACTIARHRAYDFLQREGRIRIDPDVEKLLGHEIQAHIDDLYAADELMHRIRAALSVGDRGLFDLVLAGYEGRALADRLGVSEVTARVRLHRLRRRVAAFLADGGAAAREPD
jgi:RNA polymerase sigma factor (sigma-70 family)